MSEQAYIRSRNGYLDRWSQIRKGMTKDEVFSIIPEATGEPFTYRGFGPEARVHGIAGYKFWERRAFRAYGKEYDVRFRIDRDRKSLVVIHIEQAKD